MARTSWPTEPPRTDAGASLSDIDDAIAALKAGAPADLNDFNEVAAAISDDAAFAATVTTALAGKAATSHSHPISDVTSLQASLDSKAATSHVHSAADVTSGTLVIARGGTGQSTAEPAFDALAPTTTRGDIITRGASTNGRLAVGTSGYHLSSDGTDPSWMGFLQSGTGAVTRTWQAKAQEIVSVKDFGAAVDGSTNDTTAFTNFLTYCATTGAHGIIPAGVLMTDSGISITAVVDMSIQCVGTIKNRQGAAASAAMVTLTGTASLKLNWNGGEFDGNGGAYSLLVWDLWLASDVHVDRVTGITCTTSSPSTTSALWPSRVTRSRTGWGYAYDMSEGTSTQGSIPRVCSVSATTESYAEIIAGGCHTIHGTIVVGDMGGGKVRVTSQGIWKDVADNGIYNVGNAAIVQVFNPVIDVIDEPFVNSGTGVIDVYGGYITGATNAVFGLQDCGGIRASGVRAEGNAQIAKFRSTNTSSGFLHFEDCDFDHVIATGAPLDFTAGVCDTFIDKNNRWTFHHDSGAGSGTTILNADSDSFAAIESDNSIWTLLSDTADVGAVTYFIEMPTLTKQSWWHSKPVNRTGNASCKFRLSAARQQLMAFSGLYSVNNIQSELAPNNADLTTAEPRVVWGVAVPSSGYWPAGSRVENMAPSLTAPDAWVSTVAGSSGTWIPIKAMTATAGAKFNYSTGAGAWAEADITALGRSVLSRSTGALVQQDVGGWYVLAKSGVEVLRSSVNAAGDATETAIATVTVPANALGPNGMLRVRASWEYTNSANSKTLRIRFGGVAGTRIREDGVTTSASLKVMAEVHNSNSTSAQIASNAFNAGRSGLDVSSGTIAGPTQDTTANVDLVFTTAWSGAVSGESIKLKSYVVEISYGA